MLRRRSIRLRIVTLVLVPVAALIGLYAVVLDLTLGDFLTLQQGQAVQRQITTPVSNLQQQLSIERALALQYMAAPRRGALPTLLFQERRTDRVLRAFKAASAASLGGASPPQQHAIRTWQSDLATLTSLRTSVASFGISRVDALGAYSNIITDGNNVTDQAILPLVTGQAGVQAIDVINLEKAAQTVAEESDLVRADLTARTFPAADLQLFSHLVVLHREIFDQTLPALDPAYQKLFKTLIPQAASAGLTALENQILVSGVPRDKQAALRAWGSTVRTYAGGLQAALVESSAALNTAAKAQLRDNTLRLGLTGGFGLLAILVAIAIAVAVSRGLVRQLNDLRLSALEISGQRLPSAIERLRNGEEVDIAAEAPTLEPGTDEIGQVRRAFNTLHQTAMAAAADESRIRRGVNDVFRNLARRNQSLLTRQLQLLDAMERRIHDPDELADLFRIDHLTTRMRRHAEGLLIVAGGSSGRSWREPVPIVDVMRAAVAEVEDYTRIRVMSRTSAAVAGHAVADVIHLLAELLENATMFSPTNTPVRVDGDMVARGLAVEIEDRGLGMREDQIIGINRKLADPPLFDLSGTDQLGLFIAGQLARRHDIKITLRTSAFGGTMAVVLIPRPLLLVTDEEDPLSAAAVRELGGRPIPQLLAALPRTEAGTGATAEVGYYGVEPVPDQDADADPVQAADAPLAQVGSGWPAVSAGDLVPADDVGVNQWPVPRRDQQVRLTPSGASPWEAQESGDTLAALAGIGVWPGTDLTDARPATAGGGGWPASDATDVRPASAAAGWPGNDATDVRPASAAAGWPGNDATDVRPTSTGGAAAWQGTNAGQSSEAGTSAWPVLDGGTRTWPAMNDDPGRLPTAPQTAGSPSPPRLPRRPPAAMAAVIAESLADLGQQPATRQPASEQPGTAQPASGQPAPAQNTVQADTADLPVRVRQASLAPQLRGQVRPARPEPDEAAPPPPAAPSPEAARSTMAALQRGWERGRSLPVESGGNVSDGQAADGQQDGRQDGAGRQEGNGTPDGDGQPKGDSK